MAVLVTGSMARLSVVDAAPTDGTSGTLAGTAGLGWPLLDITNAKLYVNTNTLASPTWTLVSDQGSVGNVSTADIAAGALAASAGGRALMADNFFSVAAALAKFATDAIANAFLLQVVADGSFVADAPTQALFADSFMPLGKLAVPKWGVLTETHAFGTFTDGGATVGTKDFVGTIPAGAIFQYSKVLVTAGFAGDTSAILTIGDGTDEDRYNTGTPSVFATAAAGVDMGNPSGVRFHDVVKTPKLTVTSNADFTAVNAGSLTVSLYYLQTV